MNASIGPRWITSAWSNHRTGGLAMSWSSGHATSDSPLLLALLVRHADMADEATPEQAMSQIELIFGHLLESLKSIAMPCTSTHSLSTVLMSAQASARESGTYFSAMVAQVSDQWVCASGIGIAAVHPSLSAVTIRRGTLDSNRNHLKTSWVDSALGIGFNPKKIRTFVQSIPVATPISFAVGDAVYLPQPIDLQQLREIESRANFSSVRPGAIALVNSSE